MIVNRKPPIVNQLAQTQGFFRKDRLARKLQGTSEHNSHSCNDLQEHITIAWLVRKARLPLLLRRFEEQERQGVCALTRMKNL